MDRKPDTTTNTIRSDALSRDMIQVLPRVSSEPHGGRCVVLNSSLQWLDMRVSSAEGTRDGLLYLGMSVPLRVWHDSIIIER